MACSLSPDFKFVNIKFDALFGAEEERSTRRDDHEVFSSESVFGLLCALITPSFVTFEMIQQIYSRTSDIKLSRVGGS